MALPLSFAIRQQAQIVMSDEQFRPPSEFALTKFRERIDQDTALPASIKSAILADLSSDNPGALSSLWDALQVEEGGNETGSA